MKKHIAFGNSTSRYQGSDEPEQTVESAAQQSLSTVEDTSEERREPSTPLTPLDSLDLSIQHLQTLPPILFRPLRQLTQINFDPDSVIAVENF